MKVARFLDCLKFNLRKISLKTLIIRGLVLAAISFTWLYFSEFSSSDLSTDLSFRLPSAIFGLLFLICILAYFFIGFLAWKRASLILSFIFGILSCIPVAYEKMIDPRSKKERFQARYNLSNVRILIFHDDHGGWLGNGYMFCLMEDKRFLKEAKSGSYRPLPFSAGALKLIQDVQNNFDLSPSDMPNTTKDNLFYNPSHDSPNVALNGTVEVIATNRSLKWYFNKTKNNK